MKKEKYIPLKDIKELRKKTNKFVTSSAYTKDRTCLHYELNRKGNKEVERYHLFNKYTLEHLESYDTTRFFNTGDIASFGCLIEDINRTKQNKVKTYNSIDKGIFEFISKYK